MEMPRSTILVELQEHMGSDRTIAEAAWTSSTTYPGREKKTDEQAEDLVRRCIREGHAVPLETVVFRFWIRLPVFADRQLMTHRMMSSSGMSGRYRTMPSDDIAIPPDVLEILALSGMEKLSYELSHQAYEGILQAARRQEANGQITNAQYKRLREFTRGILPQAAMTERVVTINLRSWVNLLRLRLSSHAQPEIRGIAEQMYRAVRNAQICPVALDELGKVGWSVDPANFEWEQYVQEET